MAKFIAASVAALVVLLIIWWPAGEEGASVPSSQPVLQASANAGMTGPSVEPLDTAPFVEPPAELKPRNLLFVDRLTGRSLEGVAVVLRRADGTELEGLVTSSRGTLVVPPEFADLSTVRARLPAAFGAGETTLQWPGDFVAANEAGTGFVGHQAALPAYAVVKIASRGAAEADHPKATWKVAPLPPLPSVNTPSYDALSLKREHLPITYIDALRDVGLWTAPIPECKVEWGTEGWSARIPYSGEVFLQAMLSGYESQTCVLKVAQGQLIEHTAVWTSALVVTGSILVDGKPVPPTKVTVFCNTELSESQAAAYGSETGFVLARRKGESLVWATAKLSGWSDANGRFRIEVPFTDRVAVGLFELESAEQRVWRTKAGAANVPVDIDLHTRKLTGSRARMRVVRSEGGAAVTGAQVAFAVKDDPYGINYPKRIPDAEGWVAIDDVLSGTGGSEEVHCLVMGGAKVLRGVAVPADGRTISVAP